MTHPRDMDEDSTQSERSPLLPEASGKAQRHPQFWSIFCAIVIGVWLAALDATVVATLVTPISSSFGAANYGSWLGIAYLLTNSAFQSLYPKMSDIFGRRPALLTANLIFFVGTLGCGVSRSMGEVIFWRGVAGVGGGGLTSLSSTIMSDLVPLRERGAWQGWVNLIFGAGSGLGGPLGGLINDYLSVGWRAAFLLQLPISFLSCLLVYFRLRVLAPPQGGGSSLSVLSDNEDLPFLTRVRTSPLSQKVKQVDILGAISLAAAVAFFLMAISIGGNVLPWSHPFTIASAVIGVCLFVAFAFVESRIAENPVIPPGVLLTRTVLFSALSNGFSSFVAFDTVYNIPIYFQAVELLSPFQAGLRLIPLAVALSVGSLTAGLVMAKTGKYYFLLMAVCSLTVAGLVSISTWSPDPLTTTMRIRYWTDVLPVGFGNGAIITILLIAMISGAEPEAMAMVTGISYLFRSLGQVLGVGLSSSVMQQILSRALSSKVSDSDLVEQIRRDVGFVKTLPTDLREIARQCYLQGLRGAFILGAVAALLSLLSAVLIGEHPLSTKQPNASRNEET